MIEIKSRWNSSKVLFRSETSTTLREALEMAVKAKTDISGA